MSFIIDWKTHLKCIIVSIIITAIFYTQFGRIIEGFLENGIFSYDDYRTIVLFYICVIFILIPLSLFHEFIHGITFKFFGGRVVYGFKGVYAYTQEISGKRIKRNMFLIVLLMPLTIISLLCIIINSKLSGLIFMLNLLGSSGDIYIALTLASLSSSSYIIDRKYGYDVELMKD